jgi:hypothetical protein
VDVDLVDVMFGVTSSIEIDTAVLCETCEGSCASPGTSPRPCDICGGSGSLQRTVRSVLGNMVTQSPCGSCRGFGSVIDSPCPTCAGQGRVRATRSLSALRALGCAKVSPPATGRVRSASRRADLPVPARPLLVFAATAVSVGASLSLAMEPPCVEFVNEPSCRIRPPPA